MDESSPQNKMINEQRGLESLNSGSLSKGIILICIFPGNNIPLGPEYIVWY